ncbi:MAG: tetratricopeptide repeat protein [Pseudomonadota bacterium]
MRRRPANRLPLIGAIALAWLVAAPALAQTAARVEVERIGDTARVLIVYPEALGGQVGAQAEVAAEAVLVARFDEPILADAQVIADAAPDLVAMGRIDPDGRVLRLALNRAATARVSVSHNVIAVDLSPPGAEPLADIVSPFEARRIAEAQAAERAAAEAAAQESFPPALPVTLRTGSASEYTRIEFVWPQEVGFQLVQEGDEARLAFERAGEGDFAPLRVDPPSRIDEVEVDADPRGLSFTFYVEPGMQARAWSDGPRIVLDVSDPGRDGPQDLLTGLAELADALAPQETPADPVESEQAEAPSTALADVAEQDLASPPSLAGVTPIPERVGPDPVPANGVVRAAARPSGSDLVLTFQWENLPGAAVFRRAEALWIVFDAAAELDLDELGAGGRRHVRGFEAYRGDDYSAVRISAMASTQAEVRADGAAWTVVLTDTLTEPPEPVRIARDTRFDAPARIRLAMAGARSVRRVADPVVGDSLLVLTGEGERSGVIAERRLVEAGILSSAHGVAIRPVADDLQLTLTAGGAVLTRPGGMRLSRAANPALGAQGRRPVSAGYLDFEGWRGPGAFGDSAEAMRRRASLNEPEAMLALARFYLGWELGAEALGAAKLAVELNPRYGQEPEVKALIGGANYLMARLREADDAFSDPGLANDAAAQPWRGLIAARNEEWAEARRYFEAGRDAVFFYAPEWRARFRAAHARTALETGDLGAAAELLSVMQTDEPDAEAEADAELVAALLDARMGRVDQSLERLAALGFSRWEPIQARALLEKARIELSDGRITPAEAAEALEGLRYRWRGDATELEASRLLGEIYAGAGRYAQALEVMRTAQARFPDTALARRIGADMDALFRRLYLEDEADRMGPIEALALYRDYAFLTPIGSEGDRMVRRIADRLVQVDLLGDAAELLDHQVYERLRGRARADVASDLAVVYLMDDRPQDALRTLRETRVAGLDRTLLGERRLLEARALSELGRYDIALELIDGDRSPAAQRLRADASWSQRDWPGAGRRLEALLGERWREATPLTDNESHEVLRAAIAFALAGDEASVARLKSRYAQAMAHTRHATAFSLLAEDGVAAGDARLVDMVNQLADMQGMDGFMSGFARRFTEEAGES